MECSSAIHGCLKFSRNWIEVLHFWQVYRRNDMCPPQYFLSWGSWCWYIWLLGMSTSTTCLRWFQLDSFTIKLPSFPLQLINFIGSYFEDVQTTFSSNVWPIILASICLSCLQKGITMVFVNCEFIFLSILLIRILKSYLFFLMCLFNWLFICISGYLWIFYYSTTIYLLVLLEYNWYIIS